MFDPKKQIRARRHSSSWRQGSLHLLLAFESKLNLAYTEYAIDGRPLLQNLYAGEPLTSADEPLTPASLIAAEQQG